jgi:hypothetical protein
VTRSLALSQLEALRDPRSRPDGNPIGLITDKHVWETTLPDDL